MKPKSRLCSNIKNKGGKAFIFCFDSVYRLALLLKNEGWQIVKVRFTDVARATTYARSALNDHRVQLKLMQREGGGTEDTRYIRYFPVYNQEYRRMRVRGHDDMNLSYWYKWGAGKALVDTRFDKTKWCLNS